MFNQPTLTLSVVTGEIPGCVFNINEIFELLEPNERVVWIIAPKTLGVKRIKGYPGFDPNYRPPTNKGRPPSKNKKLKHQDSLKTCIAFLIKSLDPNRKPNHVYGIKLDSTNGQLNITGVTYIDHVNRTFNKHVTDCLEIFRVYIGSYFGKTFDLIINFDHFATLNYRCPLLNPNKKFDRNNIARFLERLLSKYQETSFECIKRFISYYVITGEKDLSLLRKYISADIRLDLNYLDSLLPKLDGYRNLIKECSPEFNELLTKHINIYIYAFVYKKMMNHECNRIKNFVPKRTGKGGVTICFNIGKDKKGYIYKKVTIYKEAYNSYCNNLNQMMIVHNLINDLVTNNHKEFFVSKKIKFTLIT